MLRRKFFAGALIGSLLFLMMSVEWSRLLAAKKVVTEQGTGQATNGGQQAATALPAESAMHSITVAFDYDFTQTPACSDKVKTKCVAKFSVYDISGGKPIFLFSLPVPAGSKGLVKGIKATSPRMAFMVGKHRIGVAAQTPDGKESPPRECKAIIEIKSDRSTDNAGSH
jgi:hypothetical protein